MDFMRRLFGNNPVLKDTYRDPTVIMSVNGGFNFQYSNLSR